MTPPFVKRYLIALDRHKWAGLAGFIAVLGVSTVVALQPEPPPQSLAEGSLTYSQPPVTFSATSGELQAQGRALNEQILLSSYVIQSTAQGLSSQGVDVNPAVLRQNTTVEVDEPDDDGNEPFQVVVTYLGTDPEEAEATALLLMEAMVEQSRLINTGRLRSVIESITERLPEVTEELRSAEQRLEEYVRQEGPAIQAATDGSLVGSITGSEQQQRQIRLTLEGIDAQIRNLQARLGLSPDQAYAASALSADPIIANLRSQIYQAESQMEVLSPTLRPDHPTMVDLRNQKQAYEQLLNQRASEVIGGNRIAAPLSNTSQIRQDSSLDPARQQLANNLVNLQTQRETLQQQLAATARLETELREQYTTIPNKQLEQGRLEQQVALKRALYDQIQAKLVDARAAETETVGSLTIARPPEASLVESTKPNSVVTLLVGGVVGLLVGGGLVLLLNSLDGKFYTLEDLRQSLKQQETPLLGVLPYMPLRVRGSDLPILVDPHSPYLESYERFRSNLRRAAGGKSLKVLMLTSTLNQEGKTVSAYNLAIASAYAGRRTLLIEGDLRSPSKAKLLKVAVDQDSVVEPLRYYGQLSDCIRLVPEIDNLYIVPSPGPQQQAAAVLESSEMRRLLEDVRGRFDLVIIDTPPLSRSNDALLLEPYTDGIVMVTRPGYTEESLMVEAIDQLTESDTQFLGAIINGADVPQQSTDMMEDLDDQFIEDEEVEASSPLKGVTSNMRDF